MKNQSKMRWTKSDFITLGKAVSQFNKKINELNAEERKLYLPDLKNYETVKHNIISRNEFNRIIKSLKGFSKQGAENLYTTQTGEQITQWERKELAKESLIAERRLKAELNSFNLLSNNSPYTKAKERLMEYQEILAQIRNLKKLEQKRGIEFTRLKDRIKKLGNLDYEYMKATIYRENFMKAFEHTQNLDGYDLLIKKFNRIKNPINFYNYINQSDVFKDIFLYYKPGDGVIYGGFNSDQERFNRGLEELGIIEEEKSRIIKKLNSTNYKENFIIKNSREDYFNLLNHANSIEGADDLLVFLDFYKV